MSYVSELYWTIFHGDIPHKYSYSIQRQLDNMLDVGIVRITEGRRQNSFKM